MTGLQGKDENFCFYVFLNIEQEINEALLIFQDGLPLASSFVHRPREVVSGAHSCHRQCAVYTVISIMKRRALSD